MNEEYRNKKRHAELSIIFFKMGKALLKEGLRDNDTLTASLGNYLIFMGSFANNKKDVLLFGEMCNMMSSRRLIDKVRSNEFDVKSVNDMGNIEKLNLSNEELLDVIKKLRQQLGYDDDSTEKE